MVRSRIYTIAAWAIGALFLGAVAAVGFATGGFGLGELSQPQEEAFDQDYRYSWNVDEDPVTGLNISWFHGPVELKVGDGNVIYVTERSSGELEEGERLELSSSGGVLTIKWNSQLLALDLLDTRSKALAVQVPAQVAAQLKELRCTTVSGTVTARGFSAEELEFASDSGSLELYDLQAEEASLQATSGALLLQGAQIAGELRDVAAGRAELSSVSGGLWYQGQADELAAGTISGAVEAALAACPQQARMTSVSGGLTLALPEDAGFEAAFSSMSGEFRSDFPVSGDRGPSGRALYGDGRCKLEFATTSGSMVVARG